MSKRTRRADPLRSCGGDEEWRDWPNLPSVLVDDIAGRLLRYDLAEYLRFRAACKEWRECTAGPREGGDLDSRFRPRRWIMLSNNTDGVRRRFLNLATGACAHVELPELSGHHLETSTEGLLLLRDKASHAVRLLNPLTRALTDLPSITVELGSAYTAWTGSHRVYAGISDETSPATVVLLMSGSVCAIAYAKPGDERWAVMDKEGWKSLPLSSRMIIRDGSALKHIRYLSALTLQGSVYLATFEGNILEVRVHPKPRLVPVVVNQPFDEHMHNVVSYLVPADDHHRSMLMVRYYNTLEHLSGAEQRRMKRRRKNTDVIRVKSYFRPCRWQLIQVFKVDLEWQRLVPAEDIGRRAVFVGEMACVSLSTKRFPSVAGNAVYLGVNAVNPLPIGVRYLGDKSIDPPFEFALEVDRRTERSKLIYVERKIKQAPLAHPCSLQEYLVCCCGVKGGMKD